MSKSDSFTFEPSDIHRPFDIPANLLTSFQFFMGYDQISTLALLFWFICTERVPASRAVLISARQPYVGEEHGIFHRHRICVVLR